MKAVIFDMDGVLINSEPVMRKASILALAEYGVTAKDEDFMPFTGRGEDLFVGGVAELYGVKYKTEMKDRAYELYCTVAEKEAERFEKIPETLSKLHSLGYLIAIASAADRIKIDANIKAARIPCENVDAIVSGEEVKNKKPSPDAFLKAAEKLNASPSNCVVIEDAPSGIKAAVNAGMSRIGILSSFSAETLTAAGAMRTAKATKDILPLINELLPL